MLVGTTLLIGAKSAATAFCHEHKQHLVRPCTGDTFHSKSWTKAWEVVLQRQGGKKKVSAFHFIFF